MRLIKIGFIAALALAIHGQALAADAPKIDPAARTQGMKDTPALVQQAGVDCTVTDAYLMGHGEEKIDGKSVKTSVYEVACQQGMGYLVMAKPSGAPETFDCLTIKDQADRDIAAKKKPGPSCALPANADPKQGLAPLLAKAGATCTISGARIVGASATDKINVIETACSEGRGYILEIPMAGSTKTLTAVDCIKSDSIGLACALTTKDQIAQGIIKLSAPAGKTACQATGGRWVVTDPSKGDDYYEIGCADGKSGYIFQIDAKGAFKSTIDCAKAEGIAGGCTLTNVAAVQAADLPIYAKLVKSTGYDCALSNYKSLGPETAAPGREVVEVSCSNHPDGAFTMLPTGSGQTGEFFNCVRATGRGLQCKLTPMSATYALMTNQIAARGKTTCEVRDARAIGKDEKGFEYVEAACGGGASTGSSLVLQYSRLPQETLVSAVPCAQAPVADACKLK